MSYALAKESFMQDKIPPPHISVIVSIGFSVVGIVSHWLWLGRCAAGALEAAGVGNLEHWGHAVPAWFGVLGFFAVMVGFLLAVHAAFYGKAPSRTIAVILALFGVMSLLVMV